MNKSKFLKKSLALLLAFMLVFAMIPLGAAAAGEPPVISQAKVVLADGAELSTQISTSGTTGTITGSIPNTEDTFDLKLLVKDAKGTVSYIDKSDDAYTGEPVKAADSGNGLWTIEDLDVRDYETTANGDVVVEIRVLNEGVTTTYMLTLTPEDMPTDTVVNNITVSRLITKGGIVDWVPQLGETRIDLEKLTIDITIPYDQSASVKVTGLDLPDGAVMTHNSAVVDVDYASFIVGDNTVTVTNGNRSTEYTLTIKQSSGIVKFGTTDASNRKSVATKIVEDKVVVLLPFGYTETYKSGSNLTLIPEFELDYENATLDWNTTPLNSGVTSITISEANVDDNTSQYDTFAKADPATGNSWA